MSAASQFGVVGIRSLVRSLVRLNGMCSSFSWWLLLGLSVDLGVYG